MDQNSAPVYPPVSDEPPPLKDTIQMAAYTSFSVLVLFASFVIVVTRFRLWHNNLILRKIPELVNNPVNSLINQGLGLAAAYRSKNDLYLLWVVLLFIAYDNVFTVSSYSFLEQVSDRRSRELVFLYNSLLMGYFIGLYKGSRKEFLPPFLALWALVVLKFLLRIISYVLADRAYGPRNAQKVADYMKSEYKLSDNTGIDPTHMQGYKYLVLGEHNVNSKIEAPDYTLEIELTADVVTVEGVWSCKKGLLHPSIDKEGRLKDVCLSFALFKLLRRQYFGYPAAEAQQPKTKQLVFDGLLSATATEGEVDKQRVFRVIKMEVGFMRDFVFTRYPVGFALGFPVFSLVLVAGMLGVTIWIAIKVFHEHEYPSITTYNLYFKGKNVDYRITNVLLILISLMEILEALTYVFCDWTKVTLVCQNVRKFSHVKSPLAHSETGLPEAHHWLFFYKILGTFCKPRFSLSVNDILGQYKLLRNCKKGSKMGCHWTVSKSGPPPPRGLKKSKAVKVSKCVKNSIFDTLVRSRGDIKNVTAVLNRYGHNIYDDIQREVDLEQPVHTIMVWHIATSFCEIHSEIHGGSGNKESITSDQRAATELSNYCAYLVAFRPDLLPLTIRNSVKFMFWKIHEETCNFLNGERRLEGIYEKMTKNSRAADQKIIDRGSVLGQELIKNIPEDAQRWKMMADFWSAFILYLAPYGSTRAHIEQLANGSEFITHLWVLLYHAGNTPATIDEDCP